MPLKHPADPQISYAEPFGQWEACIAAGLDISIWEAGGYDLQLMAKVVAWHELHTAVQAHTEDARYEAMERLAKKQAKKRGGRR